VPILTLRGLSRTSSKLAATLCTSGFKWLRCSTTAPIATRWSEPGRGPLWTAVTATRIPYNIVE